MEAPCQRPKTLEGRQSDLERGTNTTGSVVVFCVSYFIGCV